MQREWDVGALGPEWRATVGEEVWVTLPRTWLPEYDGEAREQVDQLLSRALDAMTSRGRLSLGECRRDAVIELRRLDASQLDERGDYRYSSDGLGDFLRRNPGMDLVPIVVGRKGGAPWVLDGHHRMRAYAAVGRPVLALTVFLTVGSGRIRLRSDGPAAPGPG